MACAPAISIIVPVLNEARQIEHSLAALAQFAGCAEIIIVDGGSTDQTLALAQAHDWARVLTCARAGRAVQMNAGARAAQGELLLFLHADVRLPEEALAAIKQACADEAVTGGCFEICFPHTAPASMRLYAWGINFRTRLFRTATGDQAIFVRRAVFEALGGYREQPLMEDVELFRALRRRGRVAILRQRVEASPRRWLKHGVWRTALLMYALRLGYGLGISPATLKRFFIDVR